MPRPSPPVDQNVAFGDVGEGKFSHGWLPFEETQRPDADLAHCRFELFTAPGGVIAIFAEDYDAAGRIFRWLVGQALQAKEEGK